MQAVTVYMTLAFAFTPVHAPSLPLQHVFFSHVAVAVALLHKDDDCVGEMYWLFDIDIDVVDVVVVVACIVVVDVVDVVDVVVVVACIVVVDVVDVVDVVVVVTCIVVVDVVDDVIVGVSIGDCIDDRVTLLLLLLLLLLLTVLLLLPVPCFITVKMITKNNAFRVDISIFPTK